MSVERVIVYIICSIFQGFAAMKILDVQINFKQVNTKFKLLIFLSLLSFISLVFVPNEFRFVYFLLSTAIVLWVFTEIKDRKIILYSFNMMILISVSEIIVSFCLALFGMTSMDVVNKPPYILLINILVSLCSVFLCYLPIIKRLLFKLIKIFDKNKNFIKYLYVFLVILYIITLKNGLEILLMSNYYVNVLFILAIVVVLTIIIKNEFKYEQINEQNKQMINYVTKYEKIITEQGKANHEFKNQLMVIRGYAQMNSPKLIEYLDSVVEDANKTQSSYLISQLNKFPDGGIKGLLYYKLSLMDDLKIKYDINVESGVKTKLNSLGTNTYKNITKILGVLLDNAIDASKQAKNKKIVISVIKEKSNVIFKIYNTYKGKIDISKIGTGHTTKGKGHGYGLRLVKDIIENNKGFKIENELDNEYYVCMLSVKTINKRKK